jgi:hypothetical protein
MFRKHEKLGEEKEAYQPSISSEAIENVDPAGAVLKNKR